jgi:hypothetical protein
VVADNGMHWLNVSLITNKRLSYDIRKQNCQNGNEDIDNNEIPIIKKARELLDASHKVRIRGGKKPHITLVLPRIHYGESPEIDAIVTQIRELGVQVQTSDSNDLSS